MQIKLPSARGRRLASWNCSRAIAVMLEREKDLGKSA